MEDLTGKQFGPYQVVAPLGEGGMAAVYKAYQPAMDRYVALKVLPRHFASDPQFVARFQQEARVLAKLQHPHILAVHDFGEADGYTYLVMPFMPSGTLTDLLKGEPLPLQKVRSLITQIGGALEYAHARGLVHRDVKPSNVLLDESGNCLLSDFGLAKMVESAQHLTMSGAIMGTPAYMSPEQGMGQKLDGRSDIYALGVILYEMVTGRVPYRAETPMAVVIKHISDPLPPPHTLKGDLPEMIERVVLKALAKNPDDRYQTAGEMVRAIQAAIPEQFDPTMLPTPAPTAIVRPPETVAAAPAETRVAPAPTVASPQPVAPAPTAPTQVAAPPAKAEPELPKTMVARPAPARSLPWLWIGGVAALAVIVVLGVIVGANLLNTGATPTVVVQTAPPLVAATATLRPPTAVKPTVAPAGFQCDDRLGCVTIAPGQPIHIAWIQALSGDSGAIGLDNVRGIELAVQAQGRLLNHEILLTGEDSGCTEAGGSAAAKAVAADPSVVAVIGTTCSGEAARAMPILARAGLTMVSGSNTRPALTQPGSPDYTPGFLRTAPNDLLQGRVAAEFAFNVLQIRSAATLFESSGYSADLQTIFAETFRELGGRITAQVALNTQDQDFRPELTQVFDSKPDLVYMPLLEATGQAAIAQRCELRSLRAAPAETILLGADGLFTSATPQALGACATGLYLSAPYVSGATYTEFWDRYLKTYGEAPASGYHAHAYDAARLLFEAIKQAAVVEADGTLQLRRSALREALYGTRDFRGLTGVLTCDPNGDCAAREGVGVFQLTAAEALQGQWPPKVFWSPRAGLAAPESAALPGHLCVAVNGAIDDHSFNASAWQGAQEAARQFQTQADFVEARSNNEIPAALEKLAASQECALLTAVGFPFGDALARTAPAMPDQRFQIVDYAYERGYDNVWAQTYAVDQAAFLAGYVAASVSQTGKVGTFGGMALPPVEDFMDGFALGVAHYNATHNANVAVLGWDVKTRRGFFTNDFNSPPAGANMAERLIKDGADVIFPVAGLTSQGAGEIALKYGNVYLIGTDTDWHVSSPQFGKILLTSVEKRVGASIFAAAQAVAEGGYKGGAHLGTLANGEVGLAPFYELARLVSDQVKADLEKIRADIIAGRIKTKP